MASIPLSVCVAGRVSPERIAAIVAPLRAAPELGLELVLALDDRIDPSLDAAYATVADRVYRIPYADPPARTQPWLHGVCAGEWILRLDADEIAGPGLVGELADVVSGESAVTHAWIPRHWLFGGPDRYLAQWPWRPDHQLRLVRNDPAVMRVPGVMHSTIEAAGAARYLDRPLLHVDLLVNSLEARIEKCRRYEALRPGRRMAGRAFNEAYYLPERATRRPATAQLAPEDAAAVRALLAPPPLDPAAVGARPPRIQTVARERMDAVSDGVELETSAYRARLELLDDDLLVYAGEPRTFDVRVHNLGDGVWPWGLAVHRQVRLAHRWLAPDGRVVMAEGLRTPLPRTLGPDASCRVPVAVAPPPATGAHLLEIDLVHEHVRWFQTPVRAAVECVSA